MTGEGDGFAEVVRPKGGKGGPHHFGKEMPTLKGDIWRGGQALAGEASMEVLVSNSELRTVDRPHQALPSLAAALSSPVLENQEKLWALKSPNTTWSPRSTRRASKSGE